ncbi:flagellar cap protein FliD [Paenibacillus sambharensis]|uniref:Flagellar hook-associated protein 2 n=1 Tax=Paenibacillus sambharensis TaxID=1803190 RepID=A0A2W1M1P5_9BACL|nr:flagellar filament capping protein FliD [Paenibacillus sambharensis]PZD97841.1 flagellar cap protein FliD [Paenibacillus sambharensis]
MRISGFASGLDIDEIVTNLMRAKRLPVDKLTKQKVSLEWQREQYREINSKIVDFRNNKLFNYSLTSSINAKQVNISGNTTAVSAKTTPNAVAGSMTIEVASLATATSVQSVAGQGIGTVDTSLTLSQLKAANPNFTYTADAQGKTTITINNTDIVLDENKDTLRTMITAINNSTTAGVNAFLDSTTGEISISAKNPGATSAATIAPNGLLDSFNLDAVTAGTDAQIKINGISTTRSSNTFTENGVEITLNNPTGTTAATLNVVTNTDKIVDTIKSFITDYNNLLDSVNAKLGEERFRTYQPLTSEEKKELTEDEIKMWESKAKSGLIRRDNVLSTMVNNMRLASMTNVNVAGEDIHLAEMGIGTGKWQDRGKLVIEDESKLRQMIEADPNKVVSFFTQKTTVTDPTLKVSPTNPDSGLFNRLSNSLLSAVEQLAKKAGTSQYSSDVAAAFSSASNMGEQLRSIDNRIGDWNKRLAIIENRYYKQFTAMETAMNRFSAQASSLFS